MAMRDRTPQEKVANARKKIAAQIRSRLASVRGVDVNDLIDQVLHRIIGRLFGAEYSIVRAAAYEVDTKGRVSSLLNANQAAVFATVAKLIEEVEATTLSDYRDKLFALIDTIHKAGKLPSLPHPDPRNLVDYIGMKCYFTSEEPGEEPVVAIIIPKPKVGFFDTRSGPVGFLIATGKHMGEVASSPTAFLYRVYDKRVPDVYSRIHCDPKTKHSDLDYLQRVLQEMVPIASVRKGKTQTQMYVCDRKYAGPRLTTDIPTMMNILHLPTLRMICTGVLPSVTPPATPEPEPKKEEQKPEEPKLNQEDAKKLRDEIYTAREKLERMREEAQAQAELNRQLYAQAKKMHVEAAKQKQDKLEECQEATAKRFEGKLSTTELAELIDRNMVDVENCQAIMAILEEEIIKKKCPVKKKGAGVRLSNHVS